MRWGILGTGKIAHDFVTAVGHVEDIQVVACGSRSLERSTQFAEAHNIATPYGSYEELLMHDCDVIYVASPHGLHFQHMMQCIEAGRNVLCEKAFTLNAAQAKKVCDAAKQKKVFVMEAMWTRFLPCILALQQLLASNAIGEVVTAQGTFGFVDPGAARLSVRALGGGALLDIGIYLLTLAGIAYGDKEPEVVSAIGNLYDSGTGADEQVQMVLRYGQHSTASLFCSLRAHLPNEFHIVGTQGRIHIHAPFWTPTSFTVVKEGVADEKHEFQPVPLAPGETYNFLNSVNLRFEAMHVEECLRGGLPESPVMPLSKTVQYMALLDEMRRRVGVVYDCDNE